MDIFIVTGTHFSHPTIITRCHASEHKANVAATELVNQLRADLDSEVLPPVDANSWQLGLLGAQAHRIRAMDIDLAGLAGDDFATIAEFDVWIEKVKVEGLSALAVDDRELSTVLAALRGHQRRTCPPDLLDIATNGGRNELMTPDEIDDLCERINGAASPRREANIVVEVEGGMVQNIIADRSIKLRVVDYDVESTDPDDLVMLPGEDGDPVPATVSCWTVDSICIDPGRISCLDEALGSGD